MKCTKLYRTSVPAELYIRALSGLVMASVALFVTYTGEIPFASLILFINLFMCWEWSRLTYDKGYMLPFVVLSLGCIGVFFFAIFEAYIYALGVIALSAILSFGLNKNSDAEKIAPFWSVAGVFYIALPTLSLIWLRHDPNYGLHVIFYIFFIVWFTDSGAYLIGRAIGGAKLWPQISPNKTWAGCIGGLIASVVFGCIFAHFLYPNSLVPLIFLSLFLGLATQMGDLFESAIKRNFGQKDTSDLIPGHGGILDRVDGLVFAACSAALLALCLEAANPGRALLVWGS